MKDLVYYAHRYGGSAANLARAKERFAQLQPEYEARGCVLWAPWIALAEAGVSERIAWDVLYESVAVSNAIVLDKDGAPLSDGMIEEKGIATDNELTIEEIGSEVEEVES
jgi:hypothetical protein